MTVNIAFLCTDGVVLAADSMLTTSNDGFPAGTGRGTCTKLHAIGPDKLYVWAGEQGQADRFRMHITLFPEPDADCRHVLEHMVALSEDVLNGLQRTMSSVNVDCESFVAFRFADAIHCCAFRGAFQPVMMGIDNYFMALGSGKQLADPFLKYITDIMCPRQPTVSEAIFLAYWTILHVIDAGPGGVDHPIRIGTLTHDCTGPRVKVLDETEIDDQKQTVFRLQEVIRDWRNQVSGSVQVTVPPPPEGRARRDRSERPDTL